jgi:hypothetical protein
MLIDYRLSKTWNREASGLDTSLIDETALRYDLALGGIVLRSDGEGGGLHRGLGLGTPDRFRRLHGEHHRRALPIRSG